MVKSVVMLWEACLLEAGLLHHVRTHRDLAYARKRVESEGLSFLTITLPAFEKDLLQAFSRGRIGSDLFDGFSRRGGLPKFLSGFLSRVFDSDGTLKSRVDHRLIKAVRQVLLLVSKIELQTQKVRDLNAIRQYVETDVSLPVIPDSLLRDFGRVSENLLGSYLRTVSGYVSSDNFIPRHSGGSLATRESYNSRFASLTWTDRLQEVFPYWDHLLVSPRHIVDEADRVSLLDRESEVPVRVITVPKTMKTPRIIAMEPVWNQYVQQGILRGMSMVLVSQRFSALRRTFGWLDQLPNRQMAKLGSLNGSLATIDLSEASDRVSLQLAESLLSPAPFLSRAVMACRSERAQVPGYGTIYLRKFASMGSSLCFPVETMTFFVLAAIAWARHIGVDPSHVRWSDLPLFRIFGDDIVFPAVAAQHLSETLEAYGLKVNSRKSFSAGPFRESCGADWYEGWDVSVVKCRAPLPQRERQTELLERSVDLHNRLYEAGWFSTAKAVREHLMGVSRKIRFVPYGSFATGLWTYDERKILVRRSVRYHCREIQAMVFLDRKPVDPLGGYGALKKWYTNRGIEPLDVKHLERDGRSQRVGVTVGWIRS